MPQLDVASTPQGKHKGILAMTALKGTPSVNAGDLKKMMDRHQAAIKFQRKQGDLLTPQALQIMLLVAIQPGITMQALQEPTGLNISSISRNCTALGEWHRLGKPGLEFLQTEPDPVERRRFLVFLTKKGREFLSTYLTILTGEAVTVESPTASEYLNKVHRSAR